MSDFATSRPDSRKLLQQASLELQRRLALGEPRPIEEILSSYPELASDPECAIALILEEFRIRRNLGQPTTSAAFLERFPHLRAKLEPQLRERECADAGESGVSATISAETLPLTA